MSTTVYVIRDRAGNPLAVHERVDLPDGDKTMKWRQPNGVFGLNGRSVTSMLYGLELLDQYPEVGTAILTEGEKSSDALNGIGFLALATVCGASSTPTKEVLAHLVGRRVLLWPDADEAGRRHMHRIAAILHDLEIEVEVITWPAAPEHGDAADLMTPSMTPDEVKAAVKVEPYEAPPPELEAKRPNRIRCLMSDPRAWELYWPDVGWQRESSARLLVWGRVQTDYLEQFGRAPLWTPQPITIWPPLIGGLMDAMTDEDRIEPPMELTLRGRVLELLAHHCGTTAPDKPQDPKRLETHGVWWDLEGERVYFKLAGLIRHHHATTSYRYWMSAAEIKRGIEELEGWCSVRMDISDKNPGEKRKRLRFSSISMTKLVAWDTGDVSQ